MRPIRGVIFDFHATLVDQGEPDAWLDRALARLNPTVELQSGERSALEERLDRIWVHARDLDPRSDRDLSAEQHRAVFHAALTGHVAEGFREALYDVMLDAWWAYEEAPRVLRSLRQGGVRVAILSNIGVDIRPVMKREGLEADAVVLSCELGVVKPDPRIFAAALEALDVEAEEALMVGDHWGDDAAAAELGIRSLILPRTRGPNHGLDVVLRLVN